MNNLRKLAEQQKNQQALIIKNRILKQTHVVKVAESLSPITKKLDEVKESTQKLDDVIKESKIPELAIENTHTAHQPKENNKGAIYDAELENTLQNMRDNTGFLETNHELQRGWMLNIYPIKMIRGTEVKINDNKYNITPGIQKVLVDSKYKTAKSMKDTEKIVLRDILKKNKLL